jgi:hypothetical protein
MLMCLTAGSITQILKKEQELLREGYRLVQGPALKLREYCRIQGPYPWSAFSLVWAESTSAFA